jgi:putative membrane protein
MMWGGGYMGGFGMFFGLLFFILLVIAIIAAAVFLMRSVGVAGIPHPPVRPNESENKALDILKERFAKGEIDAKEFDERKRLLSE